MAEFVPHLVEASRKIRVGDPMKDDTVVGPMINLDAVQEARMILRDAVSKGGNVLYGGNTYNLYSMTPTLIDRIRPDMRISQEECFAPLATVEPYETLHDAMAKVNASPFGLQAGIYTADPQKIEFAYQMLDVGTVISNDIPTYRCDKLPYGGVKLSGLGREGVMAGIVSMSVEKPLVLNS